MSDITFRRLTLDELDPAYAIVCQATDWLLGKGIDQWRRPIPLAIYRQRQADGYNYGLFVGGDLAVVVSLYLYRPAYWQDALPDTDFIWLGTLASGTAFKGRDLGRVLLHHAETHLAAEDVTWIYLDCAYGNGFLPRYYTSAGYEPVLRRDLPFEGGTSDSVLLRKRLIPNRSPNRR